MKKSTKETLISKASINLLEIHWIVDQLLDSNDFNKKVIDQICLTRELVKKAIKNQPNYQNESAKKK
jgi:hypothetical protein